MGDVAFTVETLDDLFDDICVGCTEDTSMGSGKFVNRIGADAVAFCYETEEEIEVDGWLCWECREMDCDFCTCKTLEPECINASGQIMCEDCNNMFIEHYTERGLIPEEVSHA